MQGPWVATTSLKMKTLLFLFLTALVVRTITGQPVEQECRLVPGQEYRTPQKCTLADGTTAEFTKSGDVEIRDSDGRLIHRAGTAGRGVTLLVRKDGNLVIQDKDGGVISATATNPDGAVVRNINIENNAGGTIFS